MHLIYEPVVFAFVISVRVSYSGPALIYKYVEISLPLWAPQPSLKLKFSSGNSQAF